ncbi:MAG: hypothetical protein JRN21_10065 [Nitrososphaerota archaeon]|nr:hypothetical protein [Nitrososphaerota archaeon]
MPKEVERRIESIVSQMFRSDKHYAVIAPGISSFGMLYEIEVIDRSESFFLYMCGRKWQIFRDRENFNREVKQYERYVHYRNRSDQYLSWIEGRIPVSQIVWEGSGAAHALLNSMIGSWRANFMPREDFYAYVDAALQQMRSESTILAV